MFGAACAVLAGIAAFPIAVGVLMYLHVTHRPTTFIGGQILMIAQEEYKQQDFFFGLLELLVVRLFVSALCSCLLFLLLMSPHIHS